MWDCKLLLIATLLLSVCSCNPAKRVIDFNESKINGAFLYNVISDTSNVTIYKTSFIEQYVENSNTGVLEFALLNSEDCISRFKYKDVSGDRQDIYLICILRPQDTSFIYLSAKYSTFVDKNDATTIRCLGIGPSYMGSYDGSLNKIDFKRRVKISNDKVLVRKAKKHSDPKPTFILATPLQRLPSAGIGVNKIMFSEKNKYGGRRPVVMPVKSLFNDTGRLYFKYLKPLNIH